MMSTLSDRIVADASAELRQWGHPLRSSDYAALEAIAKNVAGQAGVLPVKAGILPPRVFVSAQPTGWGKSTIICASVRQIVADPTLEHVGILVMISALPQIPILIERMKLQRHQFAVRTSNVDLNNLGVGNDEKEKAHLSAQVLFIAQQKFPRLVEHYKDFYKMDFLKYRGSTRRVKLWDEAYLPMEGVTLTLSNIVEFADMLNNLRQSVAAKTLWDWAADIRTSNPDFAPLPEWIRDVVVSKRIKGKTDPGPPTWATLYKSFQDSAGEDVAKSMVWLSGKEIRLEKDYHHQLVGISYRRSIPYNIEPVLVFDAGGKDARYRFMQKTENVVPLLPIAEKTFHNLTVRFFDHPAGKAAYRIKANLETYAAVVAEALAEKPAGEDVLVIIRKSDIDVTTPLQKHICTAVKANGGDLERLRFLTWGMHTATNEYKDVKHVILVGLLQLPPKDIIAMVYGTQHKAMHMPRSDKDVQTMRISQMIGDLNQAVGRGAVRYMTADGDVPPGCTLDIIASSHGAMGFNNPIGVLRNMFKHANVQKWWPKVIQTFKPIGQTSADIWMSKAADQMLGQQQPCMMTTAAKWAKVAGVGLNTVLRRVKAGHLPGISVTVVPGGNGTGGLRVCRSAPTFS